MVEMNSAAPLTHWKKTLLLLIVAFAAVLIFFYESFLNTVSLWWQSGTYAHGVLVIPASLWMVWRERHFVKVLTPKISWWAIIPVLTVVFIWLVGDLSQVMMIKQIAAFALIPLLVLLLLGFSITWKLAFPLLYMMFAVPMGEELIPHLMQFTAWFTVKMLELSGIPVFWEGMMIEIPTGTFEVAKACSGIRYLIASIALGCLYSYITYRQWWRRMLFIALAVALPILANGFRAYGIVMIAHLSDMKHAVGIDHFIYGWFFFGVVMFLMFWIGSFWQVKGEQKLTLPDESIESNELQEVRQGNRTVLVIMIWALLFLVVTAAVKIPLSLEQKEITLPPMTIEASHQIVEVDDDLGWERHYPEADITLNKSILSADGRTDLFMAYFLSEGQGRELINSQNYLCNLSEWNRLLNEYRKVDTGSGQIMLHEELLKKRGRELLVWSWYRVGDTRTVSPLNVKYERIKGLLSGDYRGAAVISLATVVDNDIAPARSRLSKALKASQINLYWPQISSAETAEDNQ